MIGFNGMDREQLRALDAMDVWNLLRRAWHNVGDPLVAEEVLLRCWDLKSYSSFAEPRFLSSLRDSLTDGEDTPQTHVATAIAISAGWLSSDRLLTELGEDGRKRQYTPSSSVERQTLLGDRLIAEAADAWGAEVWHNMYFIHRWQPHRGGLELTGARSQLRELAQAKPAQWVRALPWLLCLGAPEPQVTDLTIEILQEHPELLDLVSGQREHLHPKVGIRVTGLLARLGPVALPEWAVDVASARLDRRRDNFPRPLAEPSCTWLSDRELEDLIRGAAKNATLTFVPWLTSQGTSEEEGLTTALLMFLERGFDEIDATHQSATGRRTAAPAVSLAHRIVAKKEERTLGADLVLLVTVAISTDLTLQFGDLAQVKKSERIAHPGRADDAWRIALDQLDDLLGMSSSAVYWLMSATGEVFVVPAKLLKALANAQAKQEQATLSIRYTAIRHAAIPLGAYLCDLLIGMWLGTADPAKLTSFQGGGPNTSPYAILELTVRRTIDG
ncbi:hypothetical protein E0H73_41080 [Kribbella pittospori]|uniref:Uncharacterized protein n=1 Tax=Kribbella pittospori TaxID=722689 RepID=A0A4R0JVH7_9ACTN|nr:hypothetical protein [Kribbella pittospori]TCC51513.1 hypothetical protein E0H73_41080 [Kribbella pittospori]